MHTQWCECCGIDNGLLSLMHQDWCPIRLRDYGLPDAADKALRSFKLGYQDEIDHVPPRQSESGMQAYRCGRLKAEKESEVSAAAKV